MIVVSDTTPLITLMKAEKLDILHGMFGEVLRQLYTDRQSSRAAHRSRLPLPLGELPEGAERAKPTA